MRFVGYNARNAERNIALVLERTSRKVDDAIQVFRAQAASAELPIEARSAWAKKARRLAEFNRLVERQIREIMGEPK